MAEEKAQLKDEELEKVTGGWFHPRGWKNEEPVASEQPAAKVWKMDGLPADREAIVQQSLKDLKELEQYVLTLKGGK